MPKERAVNVSNLFSPFTRLSVFGIAQFFLCLVLHRIITFNDQPLLRSCHSIHFPGSPILTVLFHANSYFHNSLLELVLRGNKVCRRFVLPSRVPSLRHQRLSFLPHEPALKPSLEFFIQVEHSGFGHRSVLARGHPLHGHRCPFPCLARSIPFLSIFPTNILVGSVVSQIPPHSYFARPYNFRLRSCMPLSSFVS